MTARSGAHAATSRVTVRNDMTNVWFHAYSPADRPDRVPPPPRATRLTVFACVLSALGRHLRLALFAVSSALVLWLPRDGALRITMLTRLAAGGDNG